MEGEAVSHYRVLELLGEGGMGVVYRAEDTRLERVVALKFLPPNLTGDRAARERFLLEARAASALDHPNICTVHEIDETADGRIFIALACYQGETLRERIARGPLSVSETIEIATAIARGLSHAHRQGIVHRDVKPANIFLTKDGQVKILDFGLAKLAGRPGMTATGTTLGTVAYMSPEQARSEEVDHRTDLWSLGALLHEMLCGQRAFDGENEQAVLFAIMNREPSPVSGLRTGIPLELEGVVSKSLRKDPGERYQTADDLLADLKRLQRTVAMEVPEKRAAAGGAPKRESAAPSDGASHPGATAASSDGTGPPPHGFSRRAAWQPWATAALVVAATLVVMFLRSFTSEPEAPEPERKMLVVLPFDNLGPPEDEYFADGMTEEITSRLASLGGLGVISRTSAVKYKETDKDLRQIGEELGVDYVLEGTVRWEHGEEISRVRITPQLIRVEDDTHVWAESYERPLESVFAVQADIAGNVASALDIALQEPERAALEEIPTSNMDAYQAYLRGQDLLSRPDYTAENSLLAVQMFERAVKLDPDFAVACASLAMAHATIYHVGYDRTESRLALARAAADRAFELAPDHPATHSALGYYYYAGFRDYERALKEFTISLEGSPNSAIPLDLIGFVYRRQGDFEKGLEYQLRSFELDPKDPACAYEIGTTYLYSRNYVEAERYFDRSIALAPDQEVAYLLKAWTHLLCDGDLERARETLQAIPVEPTQDRILISFTIRLWERDYEGARETLEAMSGPLLEDQDMALPKALLTGWTYGLEGKSDLARSALDSSRVLLTAKLEERPNDHRFRSSLGIACALLGRKEEAVRAGQKGVELLPVAQDALIGPDRVQDLAFIYAAVGDYDKALDQIEYLLSIPCLITPTRLRLDPSWDPLRDHPRFREIIEKYSARDS